MPARKLDDGDLRQIVNAYVADAVSFIDSDIGAQRALATQYYRGDPFGDEEPGRSQSVSRDVHDTICAMRPSLMRIFFGPEQVVEFEPEGAREVDMAKDATEYVNYVFKRDNPGFMILWSVITDALRNKVGVAKYWWDESEEIKTAEYTGLDEIAVTKLMEDLQQAQKAELVESSEDENGLSITVRLTRKVDRARVMAIPPEEFLIDRMARTIEDAAFVAHRTTKTVSELVAMGYDQDEVEAASSDADELAFSLERIARNPYQQPWGSTAIADEASKLVLYVESYVRVDRDGDGIAELLKICTIGSQYEIVHVEGAEERPFADFHSDPEPHTFFGGSPAENVMDIQRSKSVLWRGLNDGLALSRFPRTEIVEGQTNIDDVLNTEVGAVIRSKAPGMVNALVVPDTSEASLKGLAYMDEVKESRTGMTKTSLGLDPKALQNITVGAGDAQYTQAQQHIEIIARIIAETGMTKLFKGLLRLLCENQRQARWVMLNGREMQIDPRSWRVNMEVKNNLALGGGTQQTKMGVLGMVISKQELILQTLGPQNPLVTPQQYYKALTDFVALAGFQNADSYFSDPSKQQPGQSPALQPPSPEAIKAQADAQNDNAKLQLQATVERAKDERERIALQADQDRQRERDQVDLQIKQAELKLRQHEAELKAQLEVEKLNLERELGYAELQAKYQTTLDAASIKANVDMTRIHADLAIQASESRDARELADSAADGEGGA